jgi:hypothetical protein
MPRVISQADLRRHLGSCADAPTAEPKTVTASPVTLDTAPLAAEVKKVGDSMVMMREVIAFMLNEHADVVAKLTDKPDCCDMEFVVTERDGFGRIVKMTAKRV